MPIPLTSSRSANTVTHRLIRPASLLTGDLAATEDLVQEALLRPYWHG